MISDFFFVICKNTQASMTGNWCSLIQLLIILFCTEVWLSIRSLVISIIPNVMVFHPSRSHHVSLGPETVEEERQYLS